MITLCLGHRKAWVIRSIYYFPALISHNYSVFKIGDLGVSRQLSEDTVMIRTFYGTPYYLSPEILQNLPYNEKTDIWSLGILLYEWCCFVTPFRASSLVELMKLVLQGNVFSKYLSNVFSNPLKGLIKSLLAQEYKKRPNIAQVVEYVAQQVDVSVA